MSGQDEITPAPAAPTRKSIPISAMFENVTREDLARQAAEIVKARALADANEEEAARKASSSAFRGQMKTSVSNFARSVSNSFTTTHGTIKRSLSTTSTPASPSGATGNLPLSRNEIKHLHHAIHVRVLAILTETEYKENVALKLVTLYTNPDFCKEVFDELLSLRILESIIGMISSSTTSSESAGSPLAPPKPKSATKGAFMEAREASERRTKDFWEVLCRNRKKRGEKEPTAEVKRTVVAIGIMAQLWSRGVTELGWKKPALLKCEMDSWAFQFCRKPSKDTLGCGLWMFLKGIGMWEKDRNQPTGNDLNQNGIAVRDFADFKPTAAATLR